MNAHRIHLQGYEIGSLQPLSPRQAEQLLALLAAHSARRPSDLAGRGTVSRGEIDGLGPVLVKHYRRGGGLGQLVSRTYIGGTGALRPEAEFAMLHRAHQLGLSVPVPVAFATRGRWLYRGWVVTREIPSVRTLAELSLEDESRAREAVQAVSREVRLLVKNLICHVDLHPGNVLVAPDGQVYLIDFDKAYLYSGNPERLCDSYVCRWRRAVIKHKLPGFLSEILSTELRSHQGLVDEPMVCR